MSKGILTIHGIKCNNPTCSYENKTVLPHEYTFWVNKPCPMCGEIILTKNDFAFYKLLLATTAIANKISTNGISMPISTNRIYTPSSKKI